MSVEIVAIGRANMDIEIHVDRIPKEDQHVISKRTTISCGGSAANFASQVALLGPKIGLVACIGSDYNGKVMIERLSDIGVDVSRVQILQNQPTGLFIAVNDSKGGKTIIADHGANKFLDRLDKRIFDDSYLLKTRTVHVAGGFPNMIDTVIEIATTDGLIFSFDPGRTSDNVDFQKVLRSTDLLFVNQDELKRYCKVSATERDLRMFAKSFPGIIVLKQGSKGAIATDGFEYYHSDVFDVPVVDTLGAGDAFAAGFVTAWTRSENIEQALNFANAVAALTVTRRGAQEGQPTLDEVSKLLRKYGVSIEPILKTFRERRSSRR